jgi:hypothetical protein
VGAWLSLRQTKKLLPQSTNSYASRLKNIKLATRWKFAKSVRRNGQSPTCLVCAFVSNRCRIARGGSSYWLFAAALKYIVGVVPNVFLNIEMNALGVL